MALTTNIEIRGMRVRDENDLTDVIVEIDSVIFGTDEDDCTAGEPLHITLSSDGIDPENFIAFNSVTEENAKQWVSDHITANDAWSSITGVIQETINMNKVRPRSVVMPWNETTTPIDQDDLVPADEEP